VFVFEVRKLFIYKATNFGLAKTSNFFVLSLINRKLKIIIIPIPIANNPYFNNPVRMNVTNPLYRSLLDFSMSSDMMVEFSNKKKQKKQIKLIM
tara:strand:+ start:13804 stop:14085 length:282 start_codon:yes stop_codon:yes gene_type:complete